VNTKFAIPLGKGELPAEARPTDEDMSAALDQVRKVHPDADVIVARKPGGAVKITISVKGSRLPED